MELTVRQLICDLFSVDESQLAETTNIRDLDGWDSLKQMEFVVRLEESLKIEFTVDDIVQLQSLSSIRDVLSKKQ